MARFSRRAASEGRFRLSPLRVDGSRRVWSLTVVLAACAVGVYLGWVRRLEQNDTGFHLPWWVLAGIFYVAEVYVVHLQFRRDAYSFSLSEIPLVLGLFFVGPSGLVAAQVAGAAAALTFPRRQSPLKLLFNVSHFSLEASLAVTVFHAVLGANDPFGPRGWVAAFVAASTAGFLAIALIATAISLSEGKAQLKPLWEGLGAGMVVIFTNTSLALVGTTILGLEPSAAWLPLVPTATVLFAYRAYTSERQKHESLGFLYESSRVIHGSLEFESAISSLLAQARKMFRAEVAEITFFPEVADESGMRTILGPGDEINGMRPVALHPNEGVWARVLMEDKAFLIAPPLEDDPLREDLAERGIRDAMVAPLHGDDAIIGTMLVGNRLGDVSTFYDEDLRVFETLANHASVSLENARLVRRLQESLAHLTEMNRLKDDFVATVSHELRTPLTSIQGHVKTLLRPDVDFGPEQRRTFLGTVDAQSERLRNLIEDLLVVSRIESDQIKSVVAPVSLPLLVRDVVHELGPRSRGHSFELGFEEPLPVVETDEGKLRQILTNLIENALKYSPRDTRVTVRAAPENEGVVVSVHDEGHGIPVHHHDDIFERFFQVNQSSTREADGTGLGLYICRKMAEAIGGRIWLDRSGAKGSVFKLWLPSIQPRSSPGAVERRAPSVPIG